MQKYVVIGAGIAGASIAYQLARSGTKVTIVDRQDNGQATDAAAGIICPWLSQRRNKAWYTLAKNGASFYPELIKQLAEDGETKTGYTRVGAISIHHDEKKLCAVKNRALNRREHAPEIGDVAFLDQKETKAMFPLLADGYSSVHVSGAARVDGRALRDALLCGAEKHGARFLHGNAELLYEGKHISGISVNGDELKSDMVIAATGVWMDQLLAPLHIAFHVIAQKAQIMHVEVAKSDTASWPVVMPPNDQYMLAFDNQRIVIGATHENDAGFNTRVTAGGVHEILTKALEIAPDLANSKILETRVGFRPSTPGFLPVLGPLPGFEGLLVVNGLGASGLTMGPYVGAQLAKLALGKETELDLADYDVAGAIRASRVK